MQYLGLFNYWVFAVLLVTGLYAVMVKTNLVKKLLALTMFQSAVFLLYITMDKIEGGTAPILLVARPAQLYSNPLPQVLILTAIVVGIATLALGLALVVRIHEVFGTIEEDRIYDPDRE
jgi:multicomponent Na+:H+ antiporter subunit C